MNYLVTIFLLAFAFVRAAYDVSSNPQNLPNLLLRPHLTLQDPSVSLGCFPDYIVKSKECIKGYGQDYNQCFLDANASRQATDAEMVEKRDAIRKISQDISKRLAACDIQNTTLQFFDCHARIGADNTKQIYSISGNASDYANVLQEKYHMIDLRHKQCCKSSERNYVECTAANYRYLQECLGGRIKPSQSTSKTMITTSPQPTTTSSTAAALILATTKAEPSPKLAIKSS